VAVVYGENHIAAWDPLAEPKPGFELLEALNPIAFAMQKSQLCAQLALAECVLVVALSDDMVGQAGKPIFVGHGLMLRVADRGT
jgi:hypothetical protein